MLSFHAAIAAFTFRYAAADTTPLLIAYFHYYFMLLSSAMPYAMLAILLPSPLRLLLIIACLSPDAAITFCHYDIRQVTLHAQPAAPLRRLHIIDCHTRRLLADAIITLSRFRCRRFSLRYAAIILPDYCRFDAILPHFRH